MFTCYIIVKFYPIWQVYTFLSKFFNLEGILNVDIAIRYLILELCFFRALVFLTDGKLKEEEDHILERSSSEAQNVVLLANTGTEAAQVIGFEIGRRLTEMIYSHKEIE